MAVAKNRKAAKKSSPANGTKRAATPARQKNNQPEQALNQPAVEPDDQGNQSPFTFMRNFSDEMDRLFGGYGFGRGWLAPTVEGGLDRLASLGSSRFSPQIEVFERDDQLIIRADLPGMTKNDVNIDVGNEAVVIRGRRQSDHQEEAKGYYRSERSYGNFYRRIPLPEGVNVDHAQAEFQHGVLEISIPAGQGVQEKRRPLEIGGEADKAQRSKAKTAGKS